MRPKLDKNETEIETKDASLSLVNSPKKTGFNWGERIARKRNHRVVYKSCITVTSIHQ